MTIPRQQRVGFLKSLLAPSAVARGERPVSLVRFASSANSCSATRQSWLARRQCPAERGRIFGFVHGEAGGGAELVDRTESTRLPPRSSQNTNVPSSTV